MTSRRGFLLQSLGVVVASRLPFARPGESELDYAEATTFPAPWVECWLDGVKQGEGKRWVTRALAGRDGWVDRFVFPRPAVSRFEYEEIERVHGHVVLRLYADAPAWVRERLRRERRTP